MNVFAETSDITKQLLDGVMEQVTITDDEAFVNDTTPLSPLNTLSQATQQLNT